VWGGSSARQDKKQPAPSSSPCSPLSLPLFGEEGVTSFLPCEHKHEKAPDSPLSSRCTPSVGQPPGRQPGGAAGSVPWGTSPTASPPPEHPRLSMERSDISKPTGGRDVYPDETPLALPEPGCHSPQHSCVSSRKKKRVELDRKPCAGRGKPMGQVI